MGKGKWARKAKGEGNEKEDEEKKEKSVGKLLKEMRGEIGMHSKRRRLCKELVLRKKITVPKARRYYSIEESYAISRRLAQIDALYNFI